MIRVLERFFSGNSTDYILDMRKEDPVIRKTTWLERLVSWLRPKWLPFFKKNVYLINEIGQKTIAKLLAETLRASDPNADACRLKWAKTKLTLVAASRDSSYNSKFKEQLSIMVGRTFEQIKLSGFSPTDLKIKKEHESIYLESVSEELSELVEVFKTGSPTHADMRLFLRQIERLSQLFDADPYELMAKNLKEYVPLDESVSPDELIVRLTNIRFLCLSYPSQSIVEAKNRYAQKMFCEMLATFQDKAPLHAYASFVTFYEGQEALLLQDIEKNEQLLSLSRKQLALNFVSELKTPWSKGIKHLLSYEIFFKDPDACALTTSGEDVKQAYKELERRVSAEACLQEDEFAQISHVCEVLVPGCTLS